MADHDPNEKSPGEPGSNAVEAFLDMQGAAMREMFAGAFAGAGGNDASLAAMFPQGIEAGELADWTRASTQLQR
ncbi:MAG: hypothetical protein ACOCYR_08120, partial [Erythrobacter sp.]